MRKEILFISIIGGFLGPFSEIWYLTDYWNPQLFNGWIIGLEDFLFGFFSAGIAASIYEIVFSKKFRGRKKNKYWYLWIFPFLFSGIIIVSLLIFMLGINSIYATGMVLILYALIILIMRKDLIYNAFFSGIFFGFVMMFLYFILLTLFPDLISRYWYIDNLTGVMIFSIPIEELLWAFATGLFVGPFYEYLIGYKLVKK